jgi:hypothetical protein
MSPEAQRIAIAEACGWTECRPRASVTDRPWISGFNPCPDKTIAVFNEYGVEMEEPRALDPETLPDYLNDLNAMHEAEKTLTDEQQLQYGNEVIDVCDRAIDPADRRAKSFDLFHATAAQRAEAFLRTLGLWKDS